MAIFQVLAFSNRAAGELRSRLADIFPSEIHPGIASGLGPTVGTFHSVSPTLISQMSTPLRGIQSKTPR